MPAVVVEGLDKQFGGIEAVMSVSFSVEEGEICALIGPNGAGKTTVFNLITGALQPSTGRIFFHGQEITCFSPERIALMGVGRTFQNLKIFGDMSVLENVMVGCHIQGNSGIIASLLGLPSVKGENWFMQEQALKILEVVVLGDRAAVNGTSLSYGEQRMLEIARALALKPSTLLLDEPAAGLNRMETGKLIRLIKKLRSDGITIMLVEHDMEMVMELADHIVVLNYGEKIADGVPDEVRRDKGVIEAYLGKPLEM